MIIKDQNLPNIRKIVGTCFHLPDNRILSSIRFLDDNGQEVKDGSLVEAYSKETVAQAIQNHQNDNPYYHPFIIEVEEYLKKGERIVGMNVSLTELEMPIGV